MVVVHTICVYMLEHISSSCNWTIIVAILSVYTMKKCTFPMSCMYIAQGECIHTVVIV